MMDNRLFPFCCFLIFFLTCTSGAFSQAITQTGELKKWHKLTFSLEGPVSSESATPNPFLDYRYDLIFTHTNSGKTIRVPGYFAADGNASETSADSGNTWIVHFAPEEVGNWTYTSAFRAGSEVAIELTDMAGTALAPFDGISGSFTVAPTDKTDRDFRATGRLDYVGEHFLQYAETGKYFLKVGPDSPENFLAYFEFDNTQAWGGSNTRRTKGFGSYDANGVTYDYKGDILHHYEVHELDWNAGDPLWHGTKGKGIIGALNYLVEKDMNCFSYLVMNIDGDGQDSYPYVNCNDTYSAQDDRRRFDVSKLAQWEIVFEHATRNGLFMDIKLQETENDQLLDGGQLGIERKLFYREMVARFSHNLGLQWNLGEENDIWSELNDEENTLVKSYVDYFNQIDPYHHPIVIHSYPGDQDEMYEPLLGAQSMLTGPAVQSNSPDRVHKETLEWIRASADSNRKWVVCSDEIGPASVGLYPDTTNNRNNNPTNVDEIRKQVLWGNLMAGGAGMQAYFGYSDYHHDLDCEWFGSRDLFWDYARYAKTFFESFAFHEMRNLDTLIGNPSHNNDKYCLGKPGEMYLIYLPEGGTSNLDLSEDSTSFDLKWFNPRTGGALQLGQISSIVGGSSVNQIGPPPDSTAGDWVAVLQAEGTRLPIDPDFEEVFNLKVYPNPIEENLSFSAAFTSSSPIKISLLDQQGRRVYTWEEIPATHEQSYSYDVSSLSAGLYFLQVSIQGQQIVRKILKK